MVDKRVMWVLVAVTIVLGVVGYLLSDVPLFSSLQQPLSSFSTGEGDVFKLESNTLSQSKDVFSASFETPDWVVDAQIFCLEESQRIENLDTQCYAHSSTEAFEDCMADVESRRTWLNNYCSWLFD